MQVNHKVEGDPANIHQSLVDAIHSLPLNYFFYSENSAHLQHSQQLHVFIDQTRKQVVAQQRNHINIEPGGFDVAIRDVL